MADRKKHRAERGGSDEEMALARTKRSPLFSARNAAAAGALLLGAAVASAYLMRRGAILKQTDDYQLKLYRGPGNSVDVYPSLTRKDFQGNIRLLRSVREDNFIAIFSKKIKLSEVKYDDALKDFNSVVDQCLIKVRLFIKGTYTTLENAGVALDEAAPDEIFPINYAYIIPFVDSKKKNKLYYYASGIDAFTQNGEILERQAISSVIDIDEPPQCFIFINDRYAVHPLNFGSLNQNVINTLLPEEIAKKSVEIAYQVKGKIGDLVVSVQPLAGIKPIAGPTSIEGVDEEAS